MIKLLLIIILSLISLRIFAEEPICGIKGCFLDRHSETLILYFRGHTKKFGGQTPGRVPRSQWVNSAMDFLDNSSYRLSQYKLLSNLYVTGSSHLSFSNDDINYLLELTGSTELILASHSGGYLGFNITLQNLSKKNRDIISGVWLFDNFYSKNTSRILNDELSKDFLESNCFGYTTPHNKQRYYSSFKTICPLVDNLKNGFHTKGLKCMENFELNEQCDI